MRRRSGKPVRYSVRNVPPAVDRALRARAKRERKSLNQVLVDSLTRSSPVASASAVEVRDLSDIAGSWRADPAFDRIIADMDRIDPELWR